jgi:hypothetical protein
MRPRGEIRQALTSAALHLVAERGCFTGRDVAHAAQVAMEKARLTLKDMVRAGELVVVGETTLPGICRPMNVYAQPTDASPANGAELFRVVQRWADFS